MVICALDFGERYIGIALTDADGKIALRHSTIDQKKAQALPAIQKIIANEGVARMLVGMPRSLAGSDSGQTKVTQAFVARLQRAAPSVAVLEVDETFTSKEAERIIRSEGGQINEAHAEAARLMLADYLQRTT